MAVERVVNACLQEATEDWGDGDCRLQDAIALAELACDAGQYSQRATLEPAKRLTLIVPAAKDVIQSGPVPCFEETDYEPQAEERRVRLGACQSESEDCPAELEERDPDVGRHARQDEVGRLCLSADARLGR